MYPGDAKLSDSLPALIQELTLCCQAAMAVSILIALKTNIEVNYNLADKKFEMMLQLGSGKAANAPKIIKTSNAPLDFSNFPLSDNTTDNKNTSSSSSSSSSSTRASRSSAEVKPPLTGVGSESSESEVIPVLLLRQYHFFNGLMNDPTGLLVLKEHIKKKVLFFQHNLVTDTSINEFHLIFCRNVLIYFNRNLQTIVFNTIDDSLSRGGFLVLGESERLPEVYNYKILDNKIYQKDY